MQLLEQRLTRLINAGAESALQGGLIGLEKESLRIGQDGVIAQTSHPEVLGAAYTHPYITTDYSEALLEFITPPLEQSTDALAFLERIHRFTYSGLENEILWAASMPCVVNGDTSIRLARYGSSNHGQLKTIYRRGLGHRYGRVMQVISGIHFNYSVPTAFWPLWQEMEQDRTTLTEFRSACYFGLIRNVQRYGWLLYYLFGASPALCKSFLRNRPHQLQDFDKNTLYLPYATTLRMSDIGYTNTKRCPVQISIYSLDDYCRGLVQALHTRCPAFTDIGIKQNGQYQQLSDHILQIENEYYSLMRPKQPPQKGERPLQALRQRGVAYVELRSNDLNLFDPVGLNPTQIYFLEAFLLFCLLADSPAIDDHEQQMLEQNQLETARRGRQPGLTLHSPKGARALLQWGLELCQGIRAVSALLDQGRTTPLYQAAVEQQVAALHDTELTPSAKILNAMRQQGLGFFHFAKAWSEQHQQYFMNEPLSQQEQSYWTQLATDSLARQKELEQADTLSFDDYLRTFLAAV